MCGRSWFVKAKEESRLCPECKLSSSDRPTRKQLTVAIAAAFEPSAIRGLLTSLAARNARIRVIAEAGQELDRHIVPKENGRTENSFLELFDNLDDTARYAVFDFYIDRIDSVDRGLKKEFARVFRQ